MESIPTISKEAKRYLEDAIINAMSGLVPFCRASNLQEVRNIIVQVEIILHGMKTTGEDSDDK